MVAEQSGTSPKGFNGAAAVRPRRGEQERIAEDAKRMLQWGRGGEAAESVAEAKAYEEALGFNGAAAVRPRRGATTRDTRQSTRGFNGAAAVRPRRDVYDGFKNRREAELQWGRGGEAAERAFA